MKYVPKKITRAVGRTVLSTKQNSPTILFGAGVVAMGATVVLAIKATLDVEEILVDHEKEMLSVTRLNNPEVSYEHERRVVTMRTTGRLIKLYAPTAVAGVITIACLTTSHRQLTNRNTQLAAAYVGLQRFLEGYRGRVREKIGEEEERNVYFATTPIELAEDTPNGPKKVFGSTPTVVGPYSCVWDENAKGVFQDDRTFNEHYVRIQADLFTNKLRSRGYVFLNELYKAFGVPETYTGQICGWNLEDPQCDDYIDISVIPLHDYQDSLLLDFNCAGSVAKLLGDNDVRDVISRKKTKHYMLGRRT